MKENWCSIVEIHFGFKLVLIYSLWGKIETVDHIRGLKYTQEFKNNLSFIGKPKITKCAK